MFGIGGWARERVLLAVVLALHLRGAKDAVGFTMLIGGFAVFVLLLLLSQMAPHFGRAQLSTDVNGTATLCSRRQRGIIQAVPFCPVHVPSVSSRRRRPQPRCTIPRARCRVHSSSRSWSAFLTGSPYC
jgi:hypothetical protein